MNLVFDLIHKRNLVTHSLVCIYLNLAYTIDFFVSTRLNEYERKANQVEHSFSNFSNALNTILVSVDHFLYRFVIWTKRKEFKEYLR